MARDLDGVFDLLELAHRRTNPTVRFHSGAARTSRNHYRILVDWAFADRGVDVDAWHRISWTQLAAQAYPGVEPGTQVAKNKRNSLRDSLRRLQAAGLIEWRTAYNPTGTGRQPLCLEFRLLPVPQLLSTGTSPRSSAGFSGRERRGWHRVEETRVERQRRFHAPRRRSSGHGTGGRAEAVFFLGSRLFDPPGSGTAPKGAGRRWERSALRQMADAVLKAGAMADAATGRHGDHARSAPQWVLRPELADARQSGDWRAAAPTTDRGHSGGPHRGGGERFSAGGRPSPQGSSVPPLVGWDDRSAARPSIGADDQGTAGRPSPLRPGHER